MLEVRRSTKGPQIFVSRTHKGFLKRLFELEVPEIHSGTVEIKAIAREAGSRSKVAVASRQEGLDPVGATVGQRGARVQAVVAELSGEKIDVIPWSDDPAVFVANALSPAQVISVDIDEEHRIASVTVPERMLSLAIGREGQNARLAARLTGWRIDIRSDVSVAEARPRRPRRPGPHDRRPPSHPTAPAEAPAVAERRPTTDETAAAPSRPRPRRPPSRSGRRRKRLPLPRRVDARARAGAGASRRPPLRRRKAEARRAGRPPTPSEGGGVVGRAINDRRPAARPEPVLRCLSDGSPEARPACGSSATPDGRGRPSIRPAELAGRGAYVCRAEACLDNAITKGALSRALRTPLPADLRERRSPGAATAYMTDAEGGARGQE